MSSGGYFTRQREAVDLGILNEGDSDSGMQHDVTTFFNLLTDVFRAEKEAAARRDGWDDGSLPVVFIDEVHAHSALDQSDFATFLRWALFVTGSQLAHVLLVARSEQAVRIEDGHAEFHAQRQRLVLNYPPLRQVRRYLRDEARGELTDELVERIVSNIGGQLKNLRLFAHAIERHRDDCGGRTDMDQRDRRVTPQEACEMLLDDLIADGRELVLRTWDRLVKDGDGATNRLVSLKRALRFWNMAKIIADRGALPRQEMVNRVFRPGKGVSASEIEDYVAKGLVTYCSPPTDDADEEGSINVKEDGAAEQPEPSANGELWLSAASPLIRGAFAHLTDDAMSPSHLTAVEREVEKLELATRESQLGRRLAEHSSRMRASAELMRVARRVGAREEEDLGKVISTSCIEGLDTLTELRRVRRQYDALKWKNKWQ